MENHRDKGVTTPDTASTWSSDSEVRSKTSMDLADFLSALERQPTWSRNGQRAPHKALTLLYALGELRRGNRSIRYATGEPAIGALLSQFGPPRKQQHPSHPIWRLRPRDGDGPSIWKVTLDDGSPLPEVDNPPRSLLTRLGIFSLSDEAINLFTAQPNALEAAALSIADSIVPATLRDELLDATIGAIPSAEMPAAAGNALEASAPAAQAHRRVRGYRIQRDPRFARSVLEAYEHRCAVCRVSPRLGTDHFGLEAAHIRWVQADGPNAVNNGLCLCRMHHVALDRGAFTIEDDGIVRVSPLVDASVASKRLFWDHDRLPVHRPTSRAHLPAAEHCAWHRQEVFRGSAETESSQGGAEADIEFPPAITE